MTPMVSPRSNDVASMVLIDRLPGDWESRTIRDLRTAEAWHYEAAATLLAGLFTIDDRKEEGAYIPPSGRENRP